MTRNIPQEKYRWSHIDDLKIGRYAEHLVIMELLALNFDPYTVDVDDHGIDLLVRRNNRPSYDIQVKGNRNLNYVFFKKTVFTPRENLFAAVVPFFEHQAPQVYLIPSTAWLSPNKLLVEKNFEKEGQTSTPEWGMNFSQQNLPLLTPYAFHLTIQHLL